MSGDVVTMEKIVALCKRRGFVFPSSEIYGGVGSTYDYGHYGVLLKSNVKGEWWRAMLQERDDIVAIDSAILQHPRVWEASGHLAGFTDPLVDCRTCRQRFRADHLAELPCGRKPSQAPGRDRRVRPDRGARLQPDVRDDDRPRQGVRLDAPTCARRRRRGSSSTSRTSCSSRARSRRSGSPRSGKSFRNEITPGQLHLPHARVRADGDGVLRPARRGAAVVRALARRARALVRRARASAQTTCACARTTPTSSPTTPRARATSNTCSRSAGRSSRGSPTAATSTSPSHAEFSGEKLEYFDQATGERYVPHVIEPAAGADRATLAFLVDAYDEEWSSARAPARASCARCCACTRASRRSRRRCCRWSARTASPSWRARSTARCAAARAVPSTTTAAAIGKRYRRQDEIGTPFCLTIDHQSLEDGTVTLRDRDSLDAGAAADRRHRRGDRAARERAMEDPQAARHAKGDEHGLRPDRRAAPDQARPRASSPTTRSSSAARENARNHHFDLELVKKIADAGLPRRDRPAASTAAPASTTSATGSIVEEIGRGDSRDPHGDLGADLARVLGDPRWGTEEQKQQVPAEAVLGRVARLLRADRAGHRLRRGQPEDARAQDRLRLGDQRREDVDLDGQLREGRADLRPDRPGARAQGARLLPRRHRPARLQAADDRAQDGAARLRHRLDRASKTSRSPTRTCSARSATASRSRCRTLDSGATRSPPAASASARAASRSRSSTPRSASSSARPIASFQLVQAMIADMVVEDRRLADARLARRLAEGQGPAEHARDIDRQAPRDRGARWSARTPRSRSTAAPATSTTTRSSATSATPA